MLPGIRISAFTFVLVLASGMAAASCETSSEVGRFTSEPKSPDAQADAPVESIEVSPSRARIAANGGGTCAIDAKGTVKCWGANRTGTLGNGDDAVSSSSTASRVALDDQAQAVFGGPVAHCAVLSDRSASCWGDVIFGQFGNFPQTHFVTYDPVRVDGLSEVASIAMGLYFNCALTLSGRVKCWGLGGNGQLGSGGTADVAVPADVVGLEHPAIAVAASQGGFFGCAVLSTGTVACWGENDRGQLGRGDHEPSKVAVPTLPLPGRVRSLAAGRAHACALLEDQRVVCWGANDAGQLGLRSGDQTIPTVVPDLGGTLAVTAAFGQTCVRRQGGEVACVGNESELSTVVAQGAVELAVGMQHGCALLEGDRVVCWGSDLGPFGKPAPL